VQDEIMPGTNQADIRNRLLSGLSPADFALLQPHLTRRSVSVRETLIEPGQPLEDVYFPESGLASFVSPGEVETEVGVVGREGFLGVSVVLGVDRTPLKAQSQVPGEGLSIPTAVLVDALEASRSLRGLLCRYAHVFMIQAASTSYANAHFTVEQRLARWLLMTHDRLDTDELELTHEFLAVMLCVRRPGVTVATHVLEGNGLIRAKRGRITIIDKERLAALAGDSYGMAEAEYERVVAPRVQKADRRTLV
jgi:CRP-like cAMP-binding protein